MTPWGADSSLAPAGPQAAHIAGVWWLFLAICGIVYAAVLVATFLALTRRPLEIDQRRRAKIVAAAMATTLSLLLLMLGRSVVAGKALTAMTGQAQLTVQVIARQWWWEFQYQADPPSAMVTSANELHLPVGQPVLLKLDARDVIHSFWVPSLHGKRDLIPGHPSTTYVQADQPGIYRGQCAEFCGAQHARMGFLVVAEPPDSFQRWMQQHRKPAPEPTDAVARRGREVFLRGPCVMCHAIAGTIAAASAGPDLTHLASRMSLAAGTLPNDRDHLARWITDSQSVKPGTHMPRIPLPSGDLQALVAYLETLR